MSDAWPGGDFERWIFWSLDVGRFKGARKGPKNVKNIGKTWENI